MVIAVVGEAGSGESFERWFVDMFTSLEAAEQLREELQIRADDAGVEIHYSTEAVVTSQGEP